jgi:Zn finger protein HypA/HybF involved in hydrogenase expression
MGDFGDLVNIEEFGEKRENFDPERGNVAFYCKDCTKIVETERKNPQWYTFLCKLCGGKNIAIGTEKGLKENYKIK